MGGGRTGAARPPSGAAVPARRYASGPGGRTDAPSGSPAAPVRRAGSSPGPVQLPRVPPRVAAQLHQLAVGADAAVELVGVGLVPPAPRDAVGSRRGEELVPPVRPAVADRHRVAPAVGGLDLDRLRLGQEVEREAGL